MPAVVSRSRGGPRVVPGDRERGAKSRGHARCGLLYSDPEHRSRVEDLGTLRSAPDAQRRELNEGDPGGLRALGYLAETGADAITGSGAR